MGLTTNFKNSAGIDIGSTLVEKSYLIDRYPELVDTFRFAGLWLWGRNSYGNLGNNTTTTVSSPIQTVSGGTNWKLAAGGKYHTAAIKTDGTLWLWGRATYGMLGNGDGVNGKSSPVQTVSAGTNWKQLALGQYHTSCIKTDGTLWLWGQNKYGQMATNERTHRSSPVQTVAAGTNWKQVASGGFHTAAIKTDGTLWLWGQNAFGALGDNTSVSKSSPVQTIAGGTNWKSVAGGGFSTAAIKTDGTLWAWGNNNNGQFGDNTVANKSSPVQTVAGGTNWKQVAIAGNSHMAAIKNDGTLWLWGGNFTGALGDNSITHRSSPIQTVAGGTNWKSVTCGTTHTAANKTDGTLWAWGSDDSGNLGDNTLVDKSSPVQTISGGTNWKLVACGQYHTMCIRDDSMDDM
jgi:hypothetical protein